MHCHWHLSLTRGAAASATVLPLPVAVPMTWTLAELLELEPTGFHAPLALPHTKKTRLSDVPPVQWQPECHRDSAQAQDCSVTGTGRTRRPVSDLRTSSSNFKLSLSGRPCHWHCHWQAHWHSGCHCHWPTQAGTPSPTGTDSDSALAVTARRRVGTARGAT